MKNTTSSSSGADLLNTGKVSVADLEISVSDSLSSQLDFSARPIRHIRRAN